MSFEAVAGAMVTAINASTLVDPPVDLQGVFAGAARDDIATYPYVVITPLAMPDRSSFNKTVYEVFVSVSIISEVANGLAKFPPICVGLEGLFHHQTLALTGLGGETLSSTVGRRLAGSLSQVDNLYVRNEDYAFVFQRTA